MNVLGQYSSAPSAPAPAGAAPILFATLDARLSLRFQSAQKKTRKCKSSPITTYAGPTNRRTLLGDTDGRVPTQNG